jgi:hypothetical protein
VRTCEGAAAQEEDAIGGGGGRRKLGHRGAAEQSAASGLEALADYTRTERRPLRQGVAEAHREGGGGGHQWRHFRKRLLGGAPAVAWIREGNVWTRGGRLEIYRYPDVSEGTNGKNYLQPAANPLLSTGNWIRI